jgi:two-component system chemotaxis response regulator CheY
MVFLAEDRAELRMVYRELLESVGHDVVAEATDGLDALEKISTLPVKPDLYIIDHLMPRMSGLEASKEILKNEPEAKILFITGDDSIKRNFGESANVSLILKPFNLNALKTAVDQLIGAGR